MHTEVPTQPPNGASDYERIASAVAFIRRQAHRHLSLEEIANSVQISPLHLRRLFARWAGVSPKRFLQYLTLDHARKLLASPPDVFTASLQPSLFGPRKPRVRFGVFETIPSVSKQGAADVTIRFGYHQTPFGRCLLALTQRGVCQLSFVDSTDRALDRLRAAWPLAKLFHDDLSTASAAVACFQRSRDRPPTLHLHVRGTKFQMQVWRALLAIPDGAVTTYARMAKAIGMPTASRAVGRAVASNPIAWLIPCHRVIRADGNLGGYHWGEDRKAACLAWESAGRDECESER